jgi:uncharacterized membrane protein
MNKEKIRKLWLKSRKFKTIFILYIIIFISALMMIIFYKLNKIGKYTTIVLSLIIFISIKLTDILRKRAEFKFYSKYGNNIRKMKRGN